MKDTALRIAILEKLGFFSFAEAGEEEKRKRPAPAPTTEKRCKVCTSPHRPEYEEYYLACRNAQQVWALARDYGEDISYTGMKRHFQKHFNPDRAVEERSRELFERAVKEKIDYAQRLAQKFLLCEAFVDRLAERFGSALANEKEVKGKEGFLLLSFLAELRQLARQLRELEGDAE